MKFKNSYSQLPDKFYSVLTPFNHSNSKLLKLNKTLFNELNLNLSIQDSDSLSAIFTGQLFPKGSSHIAQAYAGHQFGHFVPSLGDGRAFLLGEVQSKNSTIYDIHLKGSGRTPYSRGGDGFCAIGPAIREYLLCEAMNQLGVPTTRALAICLTGDKVYREEEEYGAVFTRVAKSHIRIGTFQYFANQADWKSVNSLVQYSINRHYPHLKQSTNIYLDFIQEVASAQANMIAHWMSLGFIHGVMNTDNMTISGETIDYGPCAFMDEFVTNKTFSSIDRNKRYAYNNQIEIGKWNLFRLAECLIPLIDSDQKMAVELIEEKIHSFLPLYEECWIQKMGHKFGIENPLKEDKEIIDLFLSYLEQENLDFTLSFRELAKTDYQFKKTETFIKFESLWRSRLSSQKLSQEETSIKMNRVNPFIIPRNHLVEKAIKNGRELNFEYFEKLNTALKDPFAEKDSHIEFSHAPLDHERIQKTFCGT